eukprot:3531111-Alexandrium_andersonii.AAC.1
MSASLVGSEMCIRDSTALALSRCARLGGPGGLALARCFFLLAFAPGGPCPVSYTHLTLPTICSV